MAEAAVRRKPAGKRRATYQDVLDAPAHQVAEIIDGTLYTHPRPAPRHTVASSALGADISGPFHFGHGGPGGWWILDEPELHLDRDVLVPDLVGWRRKRITKLPDTSWFSHAPDWVCEVLSPSTRKQDLCDKRRIYGREGVGPLWLVDPLARIMEAFTLREKEWVLIATARDDDPVCILPFEAVSFSLGDLWP